MNLSKEKVTSFPAKFRRLASDTGYNNDALTEQFRKGLSDKVKDVLSTTWLDEPMDIESFIPIVYGLTTACTIDVWKDLET
jgi:hypothetical protein